MTKIIPKRLIIIISMFLLFNLVIVYFSVSQYNVADQNLTKLTLQLEKVFSAAHIQQNIITQSHYIRGYMLYGSQFYLDQFQYYQKLNEESLNELYEVVRDERKPLAKKIIDSHKQYYFICESEILPKLQHGEVWDAVRIAQETKALQLLDESLQSAKELEQLRAQDTQKLFANVIYQTRQIILQSAFLILIILLTVVIITLLVTGKAAVDNNIYRLILNATRNAIIIVRRNGKIYLFNRVAEAIFGVSRKEVLGRQFKNIFTGHQNQGEIAFSFPLERFLSNGTGLCNQERVFRDKDDWHYNLNIDCLPLKESGHLTGVMLLIRDKTEEKIVEEKLKAMAVRDSMTGLYNHSYLKQTLSREIDRVTGSGGLVSFMILDVDNFKYYNDNFGHQAGDEALKKVAKIILNSVRSSDIVGRYGGDEFAVVLPDSDQDSAAEVGERIRKNIESALFSYSNYLNAYKITVSVGVACYPLQTKSISELIKLSDEAMYRAKRTTKNKVEVYSSIFEELLQKDQGDRRITPHMWTLLQALKVKDPYTYAHSENVALYAESIAKQVHQEEYEINRIKTAAFLHDLGKLKIPVEILTKEGPLDDQEWTIVKEHSFLGSYIVGQIAQLEELVPLILHHHERYDGKGYPEGLTGDQIPLGARIIAIADAFDAITSYRPYRPARTTHEALNAIKIGAGTQFDPVLSEAFLEFCEERERLLC